MRACKGEGMCLGVNKIYEMITVTDVFVVAQEGYVFGGIEERCVWFLLRSFRNQCFFIPS